MNEAQQKTGKEGESEAKNDFSDGSEPQALSLLERADKARQGLANENERLERNLKELRELEVRRTLGGSSEAGRSNIKEPDLSPIEYSKLALAGKLPRK
jgi:hypothetical protein